MTIGIIFIIISIYLVCGLAFAIAFVIKGINKVDEAANGSPVGFRIIIIPGAMVFWVFLLRKWLNANKKDHHD